MDQTRATLGEEIRRARKHQGLTQEQLAKHVGTTKQWINRIERGSQAPSLDLLVKLRQALRPAAEEINKTEVAEWLLLWCETQVKERLPDASRSEVAAAISEAIVRLGRPAISETGKTIRSLADFPSGFEPLTIICGDRREVPPKNKGDILAQSSAISDLTYLMTLGLSHPKTMIRSDKLFVLMDEAQLRQSFGSRNLLIIGSPYVNFAARLINSHALFRFNVSPGVREQERKLRGLEELNDRWNLDVAWQIMQDAHLVKTLEAIDPSSFKVRDYFDGLKTEAHNDLSSEQLEQLAGLCRLMAKVNQADRWLSRERVKQLAKLARSLLGEEDAKRLMHQFRIPGLLDPADGEIHGQYTLDSTDFGLISLAPNPFSDNDQYVCILVAGNHGPGTAHALRALETAQESFEHHPFGGIIEVQLDTMFKSWPAKLEEARWEWQTRDYTADELLNNLQGALHLSVGNRGKAFFNWSDDELQRSIDFVSSFAKRTQTSRIPAGALPPTSGHN